MFRISYLPELYLQARALSTSSASFSLVANSSLLFLFVALLGFGLEFAEGQAYNLIFDPVKSPPAKIPTDPKKLFYSVPLNQLTSKPIIAYVQNKTGTIITSLDMMKVYFTSMDKTQKRPTDPDSWRDSGGSLCQWSNLDQDWPSRLNRKLYSTACGTNTSKTTLMARIMKGKIIMDWLMHVHPAGVVPPRERFIRVNIPALNVHKDTHHFKITKHATNLVVTKQPPQNILANTPFDITAEIHDKTGVPLTEGLDSVAYVDLTVSYIHKVFYSEKGRTMLLKSSKVRLGGSSVTMYQATRDLVIRRRAIAGKVLFSNVRILDTIYDLRLNLTMIMSRDPFLRIPNCKKCYSDFRYTTVKGGLATFKMPPASVLKNIPSMKYTNLFNVLPQKFAKLQYSSTFQGRNACSISRNFPIPGDLSIEIQDQKGNRIYSGPDADLPIDIKTIPSSVCLSSDFSIITIEGISTVTGSICDIRSSVFLVFYSKKDPTINVTSHEFMVVGHVHITHFDHFTYTGGGRVISPHMNSFIRFAAKDINSGIIPGILKPFGMKLYVDTIETQDDISNAIIQYRKIKEESEKIPSITIRCAILSGKPLITSTLMTELFNHNVSIVSLDERGEKFSDFPFFNRVCWNNKQIYYSFMKYCIDRHWNKIVFLATEGHQLSRWAFRFARLMKIELVHVTIYNKNIQWKSKYPDVHHTLGDTMDLVKNANTTIIVCIANETQMPAILHIAREKKLASKDGYQWIFINENAFVFPFNNSYSCDVFPECTIVFRGSLLFTESYNTTFLSSDNWERVLNYYYSVDKSLFLGKVSPYPTIDSGARMALGYDATWLYAKAVTNIVSKSLTVTIERVTEELRKVEINGLSGFIKLDEHGNRIGFMANIQIINATRANQPLNQVAPLYKSILLMDKKYNLELVYAYETNENNAVLNIALPNSSMYNKINILSRSSRLSQTNFKLVKYSNETWPPKTIHRKESTIPPFTCSKSCGKHISDENVNEYDRAQCVKMDTCKCKPGYFGDNCENKECRPCNHGWCKVPNVCICFEGYKGKHCTFPLCPGGCHHGVCIEPNKCQCYSRIWVGSNCHTHLAAILIPLIILLVLFAYIFYALFHFIKKRLERSNALANVHWLADWQEVILMHKNVSSMKSKVNVAVHFWYLWKKKKWYVKKIKSHTVEQDDIKMHLEMVELVRLNHQNLINYGGACLVSPNVCFLVEPTPKGSLEDVLMSDIIQLNWDFRISFIKDICRGMNYLHNKTKIGSHGRLKSSNCLLDNRWCIRITDFGAASIRYGPYRIEMTEEEKIENYYLMQEALLWTAPELLGTAMCLDDVQMGTKEGDVYSFGIVATEIASRDVPFAYERDELTVCALIDLIVNKDDPAIENELEIWQSLNTGYDFVRPYLSLNIFKQESLGKKFMKLLGVVWGDDPMSRTPFHKLISRIDYLFPTKKELMDNLMNLLESYSRNLEEIVDERTKEVEKEKVKLDNILSQMLPKKVVESLKEGHKVEPENFECVTVYYSDIVGFTPIARQCQPIQVVELLNRLFSLFDNILAQYDVYKVETIGDAYVVSSGVPNLNGKLHAGEIATAALNLISAIMNMDVSDITPSKLQIRIGIHTGPVVAGVVGLKMPRYTLFGDTMQIAATMESSSKSMHIQMSETTVDILLDLGGYIMKYYKTVLYCGRYMDTFWLLGKQGFTHPLPEWNTD